MSLAMRCCELADPIALAGFERGLIGEAKADGSFVTEADRSIEALIRGEIAAAYPEHGLIGEEGGTDRGGASVRWYIDPIDGTHNFMRGVPIFATLIAVERDGELQAGIVSAPALRTRWYASRGGGAWVAGDGALGGGGPRRLAVSTVGEIGHGQVLYGSRRDLAGSTASAGFERLVDAAWRDRGFGDFWGYMLVAGGSAEVMIERGLGPWDIAAPAIVVEEAGGRLTDFAGRRSLLRGEALASNGALHAEVLATLAGS
jgi:histidinol-phosphatase